MKMELAAVTLLSLVLLSAAAYADEGSDAVDNETGHQALIMCTSHGASVRLLQLQKSIERNILYGEKVIAFINDSNSTYDTSAMESLIDELKLLKNEVAAVNVSGNTTDVVAQFVDLKGDARNITKEFRELVHDFMNETDIDHLNAWIVRETAHDMKEFKDEIKDSIRNHNAEVVKVRLQDMGNQSLDLFYKVRDGNMTPEQANDALKDMLRGMDQKDRKGAAMNMAKKSASKSVKVQSALQKAGWNMGQGRWGSKGEWNMTPPDWNATEAEWNMTPPDWNGTAPGQGMGPHGGQQPGGDRPGFSGHAVGGGWGR
jgi:hypothetical protein